MKNKYTIIDNFDKLDFASLITSVAHEKYYSSNKPVFFGAHSDELIGDLVSQDSNQNMISNYNIPYNFASDMLHVPDMLRYITGRRFFISLGKSLRYPDDAMLEKPNFPTGMGFTPLGDNYHFDILNVENNFNHNRSVFNNTLSFGQYYNPDPSVILLDFLKSDISLEAVQSTLKYFRKDLSGWWSVDSADESKRNHILFNLLDSDKGLVKYFPLYEKDDYVAMVDVFEKNSVFRDILQKLLLLQAYEFSWTSGDFIPAPQWVNKSRHLYFVTDLPKGISKLPPEYEYVVNTDVVLTESNYNFYAEYAEKLPENFKTEYQLPNLYTYYSLRKEKNNYFKTLTTLGQNVGVDADAISIQKYYELTTGTTVEPLQLPVSPHLAVPADINIPTYLRYKTIIVDNKNFLNQANSIADLFPMYNRITIPSKESDVMNIMSEHGAVGTFITLLGNYFSCVRSPESAIHSFAMYDDSSESPRLSTSRLQIMQLGEMYSATANMGKYEKYLDNDKCVKFGFKEGALIPLGSGGAVSLESAKLYAVKKDIMEHLAKKKLEISEIYEGKKCHTETLLFEIAKYKTVNKQETHVQSIFLPCLFSGEEISYIDTQVLYGEDYYYKIFTHSLVVGSKYFIEREFPNSDQKQLPIFIDDQGDKIISGVELGKEKNTINEIVPIIVRAPYSNNLVLDGEVTSSKIQDKPPLPPDIVFKPYKDDSNKILILLNINFGERSMLPIPVFEEDIEKIQKYPLDDMSYAKYKTDVFDAVGNYQIYRITKKPSSWKDFENANLYEIDSQKTSGYNDVILPNTDYYYFARFVDVHKNISNPTSIFYIRIIKEGGFPPYLVTHVYDFSQAKENPKYEKSFKKYLKIRLANGTRELTNQENGVLAANIGYKKATAGTGQLKKYKIRLTSKKTGKKIDLNIDFNKTINENFLNKDKADKQNLPEVPVDTFGNPVAAPIKIENMKKEGKLFGQEDSPVTW